MVFVVNTQHTEINVLPNIDMLMDTQSWANLSPPLKSMGNEAM